MKDLNLTIEKLDGAQLTLLTGAAAPHYDPKALSIEGDIRTVSKYVNHRVTVSAEELQHIDPKTAVVTVDKEEGTIVLELHPNDKFGTVVKATLEESDELKSLQINSNKTFSQIDIVKIFRFSRLLFDTTEAHEKILKAYQGFNFTTNSTGASSSDTKGNKDAAFSKQVKTNLPEDFILRIPLYKGQEEKRFRVEVCYDVTDGGIKFWFESVELKEQLKIEKDLIFERELEACKDLVIIYK